MGKASIFDEYARVTPKHRCPICGHDNWCLISLDGRGALCSRVPSDDARGDAGHYHALTGGPVAPPPATAQQPTIRRSALKQFQKVWTSQMTTQRFKDLSHDLGLTTTSLVLMGVGWRGDCYTFPMRNARQQIIGFRLRSPTGFKWGLAGTNNGLFIPRRAFWSRLSQIVVCEGPTDTAAAVDMGYYAVGRPNNSALKSELRKFIESLGVKRVIIVADADGPGIDGANKFREELGQGFQTTAMYTTQHEDLREFVASNTPAGHFAEAARGNNNPYWRLF